MTRAGRERLVSAPGRPRRAHRVLCVRRDRAAAHPLHARTNTGSSGTNGASSPNATPATSATFPFAWRALVDDPGRRVPRAYSTCSVCAATCRTRCVVVVLHTWTTAVLLRVIMRRAGVRPWTATIVASVFVLFGPGRGEHRLGVPDRLRRRHHVRAHAARPRRPRRAHRHGATGSALLAGAASLMCSGVSLVMVIVVGLAVLIRRGWKAAASADRAVGGHLRDLVSRNGSRRNQESVRARCPSPTSSRRSRGRACGARSKRSPASTCSPSRALAVVVRAVGAHRAALRHRRTATARCTVFPGRGRRVFLIGTGIHTVGRHSDRRLAEPLPLHDGRVDSCPPWRSVPMRIIRRWRVTAPFVLGLFMLATIVNIGEVRRPSTVR